MDTEKRREEQTEVMSDVQELPMERSSGIPDWFRETAERLKEIRARNYSDLPIRSAIKEALDGF